MSAFTSYVIFQRKFDIIESPELKQIYFIASGCMVLGILVLGSRLSRHVGEKILLNMDFMKAFSVQFSCAICVCVSIIIPKIHLPMSLSLVGAMYGVHRACRLEIVTWVYGN